LLLLIDDSTSSGRKRLFGGGLGRAIPSGFFSSSLALPVFMLVSIGSIGKRRWVLVVVSTGWGKKRRGGGKISDMSIYAAIESYSQWHYFSFASGKEWSS
jgi:hypothetical protein